MNSDKYTLQYYDQHADAFVQSTMSADMNHARERFLKYLPESALILDFGCGSGRDAKAFLDGGYQVDAVDGSAELCRLAGRLTGIPVRQMLFQDLCAENLYDGVWACASILHLSRTDLKEVLFKITTALKTGGIFYTSFKFGTFEGFRNDRYFTDFTEETLSEFWSVFPALPIIETWITRDVRPGREEEQWINLLAKRI